jgi:hypothetical protein
MFKAMKLVIRELYQWNAQWLAGWWHQVQSSFTAGAYFHTGDCSFFTWAATVLRRAQLDLA